jgi:zinc protease
MCSEKNISKTMAAIDVEVERIKSEPVTAEELSRAKINLRSAEIYEKETVGGEGGKLASFIATAGSHEFEKRYYQQMLDVQADGIMRAARKYLTPENMTIVLIVPERSRMAKDKAAAKKLIVAPKARAGKRASAEPLVVKLRLSNGTKLVIKENHKLPLVAVSSAALGGARFETKRTCGISGLMTRSLVKGTTSRSAVQVAKDIEKLAGHIDGFSGRNACGVKCEFLSENLHDGLALFADVLCHPSFLAKEVAHEKDLALKAIKDQEDNLSNLAFSKFLETLYPKHPYGQRLLGTKESVSRITRNDLVKYHRNVMRSGELIISVVGDVNPKEVREALEELTKDLPRGRSSVSRLPMDKKPAKPNEVRTIKPGK